MKNSKPNTHNKYGKKRKSPLIFAFYFVFLHGRKNCFDMLDNIKQKIGQLIAAYEKERMERIRLQAALEQAEKQNETYKTQITELERQIDNLKLTQAFVAGDTDNEQARKKIDRLMKEIDKCIKLMEG